MRTISSGSIGDSGLIAVPVSSLQNRPTNATEVLLVLDPDNQLPEINKANNVAALNYTCFGPVITVQPLNRTNIEGATVTFSVGAASAEPLSYQWRYQGTSLQNNGRISGVNSAQLTIATIQTNDIGNYDVIVSNDCGTTNSSSASLTITAKPVITDQPQSQTNAVGADVTFVVGVVGLPPLTYQWRHEGANLLNGGNISGADSSALHLANLETNDAGSYDVIVTNDYGSDTSVAATLTVTSVPPAIVQQPTNRLYVAGGNATFTVMFSGTEPLWYQWRKDGMNLADNARITGASDTVTTRAATHTSVLAITDLQPDDIGDYSVVITNVSGSITSTVAGFFPVITAGPTIYTNITVGTEAGFFTNVFNGGDLVAGSAVTVVEGDSAAIAYGFLASMPMAVTWRQAVTDNVFADLSTASYDIAPIGVVGSTDVITNVQPWNAGLYEIVVTNNYGAITSLMASVIVKTKPHITLQPSDQTVAQGGTNVFPVVFNGTEPLSLQWRKDGTNLTDNARISGTTATISAIANSHTNLLIIENLQTNDAGNYTVVITNNYGSITSVVANLTIGLAPVITNQPVNVTNGVGATVTFMAYAMGTELLSYQWRKNGTNLLNGGRVSGATSSVLALANIQLTDAGGYDLIVTNDFGHTNSSIATLDVQATFGGGGNNGTNGNSNTSLEGLLLWLPFDGGAADASGNGRDGVVQGAMLTTNRFGFTNSAYAFNGGNYIQVDNLDPDVYTNGFSFGAWVRPDASSGVLGWTYDAGWGATYIVAGGSTVAFRVGTGNPATDHSVAANVPIGAWSHLFITHSPTNDTLYLDGAMVGQWPSYPMQGNVSTLLIGSSYDGNFVGDIDDVAVFDRTLSESDVHSIYLGSLNPQSMHYPVIVASPEPVSAVPGETIRFTALAEALEPLTYQWRKNGVNLTNSPDIDGADTTNLTLTGVTDATAGNYDVLVTDIAGSVASRQAALQVFPNSLLRDMLLWLPFDGSAADASGNGRDGVVQGAMLTTNRFGFTNSAYAFNGGNYIQVDNLDPDVYTNGFSFGAWVRPDASSGVLGWTYDAGYGATYFVVGGTSVQFRVGTGNPATDHSVAANVPIGAWSHVFITHSPTNDTLYLDGAMVGQWPSYPMQGNVSTLLIGSSYAGNFNGAIDDVAVYGRALLASEVAALFNGAPITSGPPPQLESPMVSEGSFSFNLVADPGTQFAILVSTNLTDWDLVRTVTIPSEGSTNILEGVIPGIKQKFYRALQQ